MADIYKELQGVIRIETEGNYIFSLPTNPTILPNALSNKVLEDIYIIVEEITLPFLVHIYLPKISLFNGNWNAKIHIINKNPLFVIGSQCFLNSYADSIVPANSDWILNEGTFEIALQTYVLLQITDNNYWGYLGYNQ